MKKRMRNSIFKKVEDINQRDERSCTPLHYAAKNSHIDMIK
jgi:ankyrin repeat protein